MNKNSLKKILTVILFIEISIMSLVVWVQQQNIESTNEFTHFYQEFDDLHHLADYLRQTSDDLTRFSRMYVATGNPKYLENYKQIISIRNGQIPLPQNTSSSYWNLDKSYRTKNHTPGIKSSFEDRLNKLVFIPEERQKLQLAYQNSEKLSLFETEAFHQFTLSKKQGDFLLQQKALESLISDDYHQAKHNIMKPIDDFYLLLHNRLNAEKQRVQNQLNQNSIYLLLVILSFIFVNLLALYILYRQILRSNTELRESKLFLANILDSTVDAIVTINDCGEIQTFNKAAEELTGYTKADVLGKTPDIFVPKQMQLHHKDVIDKYIKTGEKKAIGNILENELVKKNGTRIPIALKVGEIIFNHKSIFVAILDDISERKQYESSLLKAKQDAESIAQMKSDFLANMSHEIRTPMNAIIGMLNLALRDEMLAKKTKGFIYKASHSAELLLRIINDILDFSKIEAAKLHIENAPFSMWDVLEDLVDIVSMSAENKDIELMYSMESNVPTEFIGDSLRIGQILLNLTSNAIKFTPPNGQMLVTIDIVKEWQDKDTKLKKCILKGSVKDSGIGMSPEVLSKLFKAFSQADTSTTRKFGGTGLGLVITQKLVDLMNGHITVSSEEGKGSEFCFTIELIQQDKESKNEKKLASVLGELNILVVEDNPTSRLIITKMLNSFGFNTQMVNSGEQAIEILKETTIDNRFDIIMVDWFMENMDGVETIQCIEKMFPHLLPKIIMVTAHGVEKLAEVSDQVTIHHFISKPITYSNVYDAIVDVMDETEGKASFNHIKLQHQSIEKLAKKLHGAHLLVVEDNHVNQELMVELLASQHIQVELANHGKEALELLKQGQFDGVLMDCQMPVMDGFEATKQIRLSPQYESLPIIAVTANALEGDKNKALAAGMNDLVTKPIRPEELFATMVKWITPKTPLKNLGLNQDDRTSEEIVLPNTIDGIDIARGLETANQNHKLFLNLLHKFKDSQSPFKDEFTQALESNQWDEVKLLVHTLKGVASNIGALDVYRKAQQLESLCQFSDKPLQEIKFSFNELHSALDKVLNALSLELNNNERDTLPKSEITGFNQSVFLDMLNSLKALLEEDDFEASVLIDELIKNPMPLQIANDFEKINNKVKTYQFEDALVILNKIEKTLMTKDSE